MISRAWQARLRWWAPLAAFVFLAIAGGIILENNARNNAQALAEASIESCERNNLIREQVNEQTDTLRNLIVFTAGQLDATRPDRPEFAQEFRVVAAELDDLDLVDCEDAFPHFSLTR